MGAVPRLVPILAQLGPEFDAVRLPGFDSGSLPYLVYFLLTVIGALLFLQWRLRRQAEKNALSNRFMQIMLQRNLTKRQYRAVSEFFRGLKESQQNEILLSQKALAHYLHQFLRVNEQIPANDRVEIFDKILPGMTSQIEVRTVDDLRTGEPCAVDIGNTSHLATILKTKENQVLISLTEKIVLPLGPAKLYAYRPNLGGFLLSGAISKANGMSAIFRHDGSIEFRGDQHLMSVVNLALKLEPWPKPEVEADLEPGEPPPETVYVSAETERLSDRALAIRFLETPPELVLKRQEFWEMTLELPGEPLVCRVRITAYKPPELWLVRPVDLDDLGRRRLYKFISENKPVREHF
ncbi:MAG: hypothetical protein OHK0011_26040 [Turneriella sp.]